MHFATPAEVTVPEHSASVWRYMPDWKFKDLLTKQHLYFCRVDRFPDEFEGIPPKAITDAFVRIAEVSARRGLGGSNASHILEDRAKYKRFFYASCWHVREDECDDMWALYGEGGDSVAIQTNFAGLSGALGSATELPLQYGLVRYLDYDLQTFSSLGPLDPYFHKQSHFAHEAELRVLLQHFPREVYSDRAWGVLQSAAEFGGRVQLQPSEINLDVDTSDHMRVPVNLEHLMSSVVLGPGASPEFNEFAQAAAQAHGARFTRSRMS